ncbi:hypothetical protein GCM10020254_43880 [Streptomyces goshikiensis]
MRVATPIAPAMTRVRRKPVMRETIVPAAIRALDLSRPAARPAGLLGAGAATGASSAGVRGAACWSR